MQATGDFLKESRALAREKGYTMAEAMRRVAAAKPELHADYLAKGQAAMSQLRGRREATARPAPVNLNSPEGIKAARQLAAARGCPLAEAMSALARMPKTAEALTAWHAGKTTPKLAMGALLWERAESAGMATPDEDTLAACAADFPELYAAFQADRQSR
jgi:hypothetical protein